MEKYFNVDDIKAFNMRCCISKSGELLELALESVHPLLYYKKDGEKGAFVSEEALCMAQNDKAQLAPLLLAAEILGVKGLDFNEE